MYAVERNAQVKSTALKNTHHGLTEVPVRKYLRMKALSGIQCPPKKHGGENSKE